MCKSYSALTRNFNELWCAALNEREKGVTHFMMLHDDIAPEPWFADTMMDIMTSNNADVVSVIVPIKDHTGYTSTALDAPPFAGADPWRVTRLTMHEVYNDYPATFTRHNLLINTGCMLVDIRKPWVEQVRFRFEDKIVKRNGKFYAENMPEDWLFSQDALKLGAKLYATRVVKVNHVGQIKFSNALTWGTEKSDHDSSAT
jgi:hypothetical protein